MQGRARSKASSQRNPQQRLLRICVEVCSLQGGGSVGMQASNAVPSYRSKTVRRPMKPAAQTWAWVYPTHSAPASKRLLRTWLHRSDRDCTHNTTTGTSGCRFNRNNAAVPKRSALGCAHCCCALGRLCTCSSTDQPLGPMQYACNCTDSTQGCCMLRKPAAQQRREESVNRALVSCLLIRLAVRPT
jgi:hypothetical protein